jgi:peptidyl-prolyl cis-trans isomerase C
VTSSANAAPLRRALGALARQRLLHFAAGAAVLFALAPRPAAGPPPVAVTSAQVAALSERVARRQRVAVTPDLTAQVRRQTIEDELLVREAFRLGLDRGDDIIRARLIQKAMFVAEELAGATRPLTEAELRAYFEAHADAYVLPARVRFVHVVAATAAAAASLRAEVVTWSATHPGQVPPFGAGMAVSRRVERPMAEVADTWGEGFAAAVRELPVGTWSAPLASPYGFHLVTVERHDPAGPAAYADVHDRLALDASVDRRRAAVASFVAAAADRYRVVVDGDDRPVEATGRVATRTEPSAED